MMVAVAIAMALFGLLQSEDTRMPRLIALSVVIAFLVALVDESI